MQKALLIRDIQWSGITIRSGTEITLISKATFKHYNNESLYNALVVIEGVLTHILVDLTEITLTE